MTPSLPLATRPLTPHARPPTNAAKGGGWCYDEDMCAKRSLTRLGSSTKFSPTSGCRCMNVLDDGSANDDDCNCITLPYCDGASFSGNREKPWRGLMHRGARNLNATIEYALDNLGMTGATQFVLFGESAGGLATFLHADRTIDKVAAAAPAISTVAGSAWAAPAWATSWII